MKQPDWLKQKDRPDGEFKSMGLLHRRLEVLGIFELYELRNETTDELKGYSLFKVISTGLEFKYSSYSFSGARQKLKSLSEAYQIRAISNDNSN